MLHAVNRRKVRLDAFKAAGQRVPLEDIVTSSVFGPLQFLDQAEATAAVSRILEMVGIEPPAWVGPAHLSLWPKRATVPALRSRYVEPDAEIVDTAGNSLIVEVKWGAGLGRHELAAQWLSLAPSARASSRHLLLVLETGHYRAAILSDRQTIAASCSLPWPIHVVTWQRLADAFRAIGGDVSLNPGTRRWAISVHGFLRREDPLSVAGWSDLGLGSVVGSAWSYARRWFAPAPPVSAAVWRWGEGWFDAAMEYTPETDWRYAQ